MSRILVVEDNPPSMELMCYLLRAFGHTVLTSSCGEKGEELAGEQLPDLIVCDVQLPGIDGMELTRRLQANPRTASIPRVAVTAMAMVGDRDKVLAAGFDGYIAKPIVPETFVGLIEAVLISRSPSEMSLPTREGQASEMTQDIVHARSQE